MNSNIVQGGELRLVGIHIGLDPVPNGHVSQDTFVPHYWSQLSQSIATNLPFVDVDHQP